MKALLQCSAPGGCPPCSRAESPFADLAGQPLILMVFALLPSIIGVTRWAGAAS